MYSPEIKKSWEVTTSTRTNLKQMGLVYDPNDVLKIPKVKNQLIADAKLKAIDSENMSESEEENENVIPTKGYVVEELLKQAKAPRKRMFRLPNSQVEFLIYLMDKHGEDYKVMLFHC